MTRHRTYRLHILQNSAEFVKTNPCRFALSAEPRRPHTYGVRVCSRTSIATEPCRPTACAGEYPCCTFTHPATAHYSLLTANSSYTFSAKERDSETGLSYFGSRYYSSDLSIWLSVDPMSDKYPSLSPYTYCADNPVGLVDPNGEDYEVLIDNSNKTITIKATYYVTKDTKEGMEMGFRYFTLQQQNLSYSDGSILDSGLINEYFQQTMMRTERRLTPDNISSPNAYTKKTNWENVGIGYFKTN